MALTSYALGIGSNRPFGRLWHPALVVEAALAALAGSGMTLTARSPIIATAPLGPSSRRFANAAAVVRTPLAPAALLGRLKAIERAFGRRAGQRWGARTLDLDILLWSGGVVRTPRLRVPHARIAERRFVLDPLVRIAPDWQVSPGWGNVRHLHARLIRLCPLG